MQVKFDDTMLKTAGVFRCCLHSLVQQGDKKVDVEIGEKMTCQYCNREFELKQENGTMKPVWTP